MLKVAKVKLKANTGGLKISIYAKADFKEINIFEGIEITVFSLGTFFVNTNKHFKSYKHYNKKTNL